MRPVFQSISDALRGDCHRAAIASLFDLELEQVPHFRLFSDSQWWPVFYSFIWGLGYEVVGNGYFPKDLHRLEKYHVNGYIEAGVPSLNYEGATHSVIIDTTGVVVHDPAPSDKKSYLGRNVVESGELCCWTLIKKQEGHQHERD